MLIVPTPYAVGPINLFLAEGDELTLIDTGPKDPPTIAALHEQLAAHGFALRDIRRIIITHAHVDHFGLAGQIVAESGARVYAHARNRWWLTDSNHEWARRYDFYYATFARSGAPRELAEHAVAGMRRLAQHAHAVPPENFVPLEDNDTLILGRDEWRVVFAPGHASGLICLYEPHSQTLLASDHILRDITSNPILEPPTRDERERPRALADYVASMQKVAQLPIRIAYPSHGEPVFDVSALVAARLAFHHSRLDHIQAQIENGAQTAWALCNQLFPDLKSFDLFLGLSEIIGHLDILEMQGRVRRDELPEHTRYAHIQVK